jgi:hypothetical protein
MENTSGYSFSVFCQVQNCRHHRSHYRHRTWRDHGLCRGRGQHTSRSAVRTPFLRALRIPAASRGSTSRLAALILLLRKILNLRPAYLRRECARTCMLQSQACHGFNARSCRRCFRLRQQSHYQSLRGDFATVVHSNQKSAANSKLVSQQHKTRSAINFARCCLDATHENYIGRVFRIISASPYGLGISKT